MRFEDPETTSLVHQYESARESGQQPYFDVEDLELILDYYLDTAEFERVKEALELAREIHPMALTFKIKEIQLDIAMKEFARAEAKLSHLEGLSFQNPELLIARATLLMQRGELKLGLAFLDRALDEAEDPIYVLSMITEAHLMNGDYPRAIDSLLKSIELDEEPYDEGALYQLAMCLDFTNEYTRAVEIFTAFTNREPYNPLLWYHIGAFQLRLDQEDEAMQSFEWATLADSEFHAAHFEIGRIYERRGELELAKGAYHKSLSEELASGYIHYRIGLIEGELDHLEKALEHYNLAIELEPDMDDVYLERAGIQMDLGNYPAAKLDYQRVWLDEAYGSEDVLDYVECLVELDLLDNAIEVLYDGVARFPENFQLKLVLAGYLFATDDPVAARATLVACMAVEPKSLLWFEEYFPDLAKLDEVARILAELQPNGDDQKQS